MTEGFHFESWLEEAHSGLKALRAKKEALLREKETVEISLEDTDKEIAALEAMLEAHIGAVPKPAEEEPPKAPRVTGVKKAAKTIAGEMTIGVIWTEEQYVSMIQERVEGAREKSCKSALQALAKEGVLILAGQRGAWSYSTTIGKTPDEAQKPSEEPPAEEAPEDTESAPASQGAQEPGQQSLPEVVVVGQAEVIAAIEKELKKKSHISMGEKNIGWIAADLHCEPKTVRDALKVMVDGDYEFAYEGETKVLRRKAEPGSKEELKRTSISDTPLFPDADRPPHA